MPGVPLFCSVHRGFQYGIELRLPSIQFWVDSPNLLPILQFNIALASGCNLTASTTAKLSSGSRFGSRWSFNCSAALLRQYNVKASAVGA